MRTAPTTTLSEKDRELILQVHGHLCPMVLLGARLALAAVEAYGHDEESSLQPFGYFRGQGCAVDGIQLFSGCTTGNNNLVLLRGRTMEFIYTSEGSAAAVSVLPTAGLVEDIRTRRSGYLDSEAGRALFAAPAEDLVQARMISSLSVLSLFPGS